MSDANRGVPPPVRGRARARVRYTPEQLQAQMAAAPQDVPPNVSEAPSVVSDESDVRSVATGVTKVTIHSGASLEAACSSESGSFRRKEADAGSGSAASDHSSKGLRVTLRDGFIKQGKGGEEAHVLTNYLHMNKTPDFQLHQYRVDFSPEEDSTLMKKLLVRTQEGELGNYIFDGHMLYTTKPIPMEKRELVAKTKAGATQFKILIKSVGYVLPSSPMYLQFYNMVMRKCMGLIGMEELGRHFYDRQQKIEFPEDKLELWPGIVTAIRNHEAGMLLCIEVTHKVLRMTTVFDMIEDLKVAYKGKPTQEFEKAVKEELVGVIVITHYNRRTYKVDDVDFTVTPEASFRQQDGTMTKYLDYYAQKHNIQMDQLPVNQPALVSIPKKKDVNKGITGNIYLFPSLCNPTGLTDAMRKNFTLMKKLSDHLHMGPNQRKKKLDEFVEKIKGTPDVQKEFVNWDIDFVPKYVMAQARKYPVEKVFMGPVGSEPVYGDKQADWTRALKGKGMLTPVDFTRWIIFVPTREQKFVDNLIDQLRIAARAINVNIATPLAVVPYTDTRRPGGVIRQELNKRDASFALVILANNNVNTYADVKKICVLDFGIGCQCFLAKNMNKTDPKGKQKLGSICTKVMIQITAKLGGVPWGVKIPVTKLMILGFDVYHCSERKGYSAGALVSTRDQALNQYYSSVNFHKDRSELAKNLTRGMCQSLEAFRRENKGQLPERVILFRDGVGEGQINYVIDSELPQLQEAIVKIYGDNNQEKAKLSVVIVTKKINSRALLAKTGLPATYDNVPPGTVIDNTITLPERYDYFLVSQSVNQGTVSPTNYNVVHDESGWPSERMQKLSFKLCHLYYNWCGTVAVPAPCQYAHKLAYLTGIAINNEAPAPLASTLWYL